MLPEIWSLFEKPSGAAGEVLTELASGARFSLHHIASHGAVSPAGFVRPGGTGVGGAHQRPGHTRIPGRTAPADGRRRSADSGPSTAPGCADESGRGVDRAPLPARRTGSEGWNLRSRCEHWSENPAPESHGRPGSFTGVAVAREQRRSPAREIRVGTPRRHRSSRQFARPARRRFGP